MQIDFTEEEIKFIEYVLDYKLEEELKNFQEVKTSDGLEFYIQRVKLCKELIIKFNN